MRTPRFALVLATVLLASPASGLVINSTWNGTVGNWSDATRWSSNPLFPNNGGGNTYNATISAGTVTVDTPITIDALTFSGGTLTGTQNLSTQGVFNWAGGTLSGTGMLTANGGLVIGVGTYVLTGKTLVNTGTATLTHTTGATLRLDGPFALFDNQLGATFTAGANTAGTHNLTFSGTSGLFNNAGTFNKAGSDTLTVTTRFDNLGQFNVDGGTVTFSGDAFTNTGVLAIDSGRLVQFAAGTGHSFLAGSTVGGAGTLRMAGGALSTATDLDTAIVELNGGTLSNASAIDVSGQLRWNGGALGGAGMLTASGGLVIDVGTHILAGKTLVNAGTATLTHTSGATLRLDGASALFDNQLGATFTAGANTAGNHNITFSGTSGLFNNAGTFNKVGSDVLNVSVQVQNTGLVNVQAGTLAFSGGGALTQTAGALRLSGGSLTSTAALNLQGGSLEGRGTVTANVLANGATILPGLDGAADDLILNGSLTLGAASVLDFDLGGLLQGVSYDYLDVNGTSPLNGTLQVSFFGGFESAVAAGDEFTLMTANAALTGSFLNVASGSRINTLDGFASFLVSYGAGSAFGADRVVLSDVQLVPEPGLGLIAVGGARRWRD
jgi:hypothetical protein